MFIDFNLFFKKLNVKTITFWRDLRAPPGQYKEVVPLSLSQPVRIASPLTTQFHNRYSALKKDKRYKYCNFWEFAAIEKPIRV